MKKMKISFISLGCDKNLVDSEKMLAMMNDSGYEVTDIIADAEAVIINTCCFIHDAKQESIDTIIETAGYKKTGTKYKRRKNKLRSTLQFFTMHQLHYKCLCKLNQSYLHQYLRKLHAKCMGQSE